MTRKILFLYTSHSQGHKTIAENLAYHLSQAGYEVSMFDALAKEKKGGISAYLNLHLLVNKYFPFFWKWMYFWGYKPVMPFLKFMARFHYKSLLSEIERVQPDMVVSTQISPSGVVSYLKSKGLYKGIFGIAFSDFHLHPSWMYENADFYLVNTQDQKEKMVKLRARSEIIFVCGITQKPRMQVNAENIRKKLGIPEGAKVVLLGSGSLGIGGSSVVKSISSITTKASENIYLLVLCGRNKEEFNKVSQLRGENSRIIPLMYYQPIDELYAISHLYITKPGGLSTSEAFNWGLPIFVSHILPGQEELNLKYLNKQGLVTDLTVKPTELWGQIVLNELHNRTFTKKFLEGDPYRSFNNDSSGRAAVDAVKVMFHEKNG